MKCHYEVLGVSREANDDDLKKAYRKLALQWHPDKNAENLSEAKDKFQLIQQAYETLSDPQERAWYDRHRESILRGDDENASSSLLNLFPYFSSCYKGFSDDEGGFYAVYRNVFDNIAKEDLEFLDAKERERYTTYSFGNKDSDYRTVVYQFYAYWQSYSTKCHFSWLDQYDLRHAENRRISRLMEKDNKKLRDEGRKNRNEQVRNLVAFVRKRDPRVKAQQIVEEEKRRAKKEAEEIRREEQRKKKLKEMEEDARNTNGALTAFDNINEIEKQLEDIESSIAAQFGSGNSDYSSDDDQSTNSKGDDDEMDDDILLCWNEEDGSCVACEQILGSFKKYLNHSTSKRHLENLETLKRIMHEEENGIANGSQDGTEQGPSEDEINNGDISGGDNGQEVNKKSEKLENGDGEKTKPRNSKRRNKAKGGAKDSDSTTCVVCNHDFLSRNKLFDHLKQTGHSRYIPKEAKTGTNAGVRTVSESSDDLFAKAGKVKGKGKKKKR